MSRPRATMHKIREVLRLSLGEGFSLRQITASLGVARSSASEIVAKAKAAQLTWPLANDLSDDALERLLYPPASPPSQQRPTPQWSQVHREMRRKGVTLMLLWQEYRESHPDGYGYTQFCVHYRTFEKRLHPTMRFNHRFGERMFVDYAGMTVKLWKNNAVVGRAEIFVAVLGGSSLTYAEAAPSQELVHFIGAHVRALHFFGGVPALIVPDNLKSGVTTPHRYEPLANATYQEMAAHYASALLPARVRKPRDKAKVEVGVQVVERWILARLRDEQFETVGEINLAMAALLEDLNSRPMRHLGASRRALFEAEERSQLRPLPANDYEFATWASAKVAIDYHVEVRTDRHHYSVPARLCGERVEVRLAEKSVQIFYKHQRVATHLRVAHPGFSTERAHMPDSHRRYSEWSPARITAWAHKTGPATAQLAGFIMAERPHPEQGYRACLGLIRLGRSVGPARLEAASARALTLRSHNYKTVASILRTGLDAQALSAPEPARPYSHHENVRGPNYYQ
jgi:transposase